MARKAREPFLPHRDLIANINIAHALMSSAGWGRSGEPPEPENEAGGVKPQLNTGSLIL